ncbi:MAG TPA: alpha/beta hydrolase [Ramlibacter sp.]|nr:alpha/beta hydrolase [Ramlibacter sp.]
MSFFDGFEAHDFGVNGTSIHARFGTSLAKPPLLLLHGFPQTHAMWNRVAQVLARHYFLVLPDLRGYGDSGKPAALEDHAQASKREMARDMVDVMAALGHREFFVCGHDRGARTAHRMALDHPQSVSKLALIDIAPTLDMYDATDMTFARYYYHWFHLIQPAPLPEAMIGGNCKLYLHTKLGGWGGKGSGFVEPEALAEYERCFCRAETLHAACEDYRASAGIDLDHDRESRAKGEKIACDTLVLWGERGIIGQLFDPLALWQAQCAGKVEGRSLAAGHFIPEELPQDTAQALLAFFGASR